MNKNDAFLPFAVPSIGDDEIAEVCDSLRSGWITSGPKVTRFEQDFAAFVGSPYAVATSSWTGGYHAVLKALEIGSGDVVMLPTVTFASAANIVIHLGATPLFVDIDDDVLMSPTSIRNALTDRVRAIVPVHFAGQPCEIDEIVEIGNQRGIPVIEDAAHATGAQSGGRCVGTHSTATIFSFYATKTITTGEGGMVTTADTRLAERVRSLVLHGMTRDAWGRYSAKGSWYYEITEPGYKYNLTDIQASLGIHQLRKIRIFEERRNAIARRYDEAFAGLPGVSVPRRLPGRSHVYHLYQLKIDPLRARMHRDEFILQLKEKGIGSSVHFIPMHRHPYYRDRFSLSPEAFPVAETLYQQTVSLPIHNSMVDGQIDRVIETVLAILG